MAVAEHELNIHIICYSFDEIYSIHVDQLAVGTSFIVVKF